MGLHRTFEMDVFGFEGEEVGIGDGDDGTAQAAIKIDSIP
jgi:hypothetical protein